MKFRYVIYNADGEYLCATSCKEKAEDAWERGMIVEEEFYE